MLKDGVVFSRFGIGENDKEDLILYPTQTAQNWRMFRGTNHSVKRWKNQQIFFNEEV